MSEKYVPEKYTQNYETADNVEPGLVINLQKIKEILKQKDSVLVSIAGKTGSGKSTYADRLREVLAQEGISATIVSSDDFYKQSPDGQIAVIDRQAIDVDKLQNTIMTLQKGEAIANYSPAQVLIVEGLQTMQNEVLGQPPDHRTYLEVPFSKRIPRRIARDHQAGYRSIQDFLTLAANMTAADLKNMQEFEQDPDMAGVDLVVQNNYQHPQEPDLYIAGETLFFEVNGEVQGSVAVDPAQIRTLENIGIRHVFTEYKRAA